MSVPPPKIKVTDVDAPDLSDRNEQPEMAPNLEVRQQAADESNKTSTIRDTLAHFYDRNLGLFLVFLAQLFASLMSLTTRLLETGFEKKFHALQVIFVRMLATGLISSAWMWYKQTPGFPLGAPGIRGLLVIRGMMGTTGLFGLYYSLSYLDIADATVITFLIPTMTAFVCWVALGEPYTANEALSGLIAIAGVLFIARPQFLFPTSDPSDNVLKATEGIITPDPISAAERSIAVVCAVIGSFCAACAYATIRAIGKRAHSLVSVNYFSVLATVTSFSILVIHPDLQFEIPETAPQWLLLCSIGLSGFLLQILLTEGLQREKAGRATNLIYSQLVFALIFDRLVWGTTPPWESFVGSALIIAAAGWVTLQKSRPAPESARSVAAPDEESRLLGPERRE